MIISSEAMVLTLIFLIRVLGMMQLIIPMIMLLPVNPMLFNSAREFLRTKFLWGGKVMT